MRRYLPPVLLVLAVFALYARTAFFGFIRLDDPEYTFFNPFVYNGLSWGNVLEAFRNLTHGGIWMPVTYLSYMLDITLFGKGPAGHHAVNVAIHAVNALLVWQLARRFVLASTDVGGDAPSDTFVTAPFVAALMWAVHPLCTEPVCWIAGRKELLWSAYAFAGLLSLPRGNRKALAVSYVCCALACMSKPTAMCFPLLALLVDPRDGKCRRHLPFWIMAAVAGGIAIHSQSHAAGYDPVSLYAAPWYERAWQSLCACGMYVARTVAPYGVRLDYSGGGWERIVGPAVLVAVLAVIVFAWKRGRFDHRILCAFAIVLPTLGLFGKFGEQAYADRFWYAALAVCTLAATRYVRRKAVLFVLAGIFACVTWCQVGIWRDDYTLFSRVLACEPSNGRALCHVASERCARFDDLEGGIALYRRSLSVRPRFDTRAQLAYALARRGRAGDAAEIHALGADVVRDVSIDRKGMMLEALGRAAAETGRDRDAVRFLEASIRAPARFYPADEARALLKEVAAAMTEARKK